MLQKEKMQGKGFEPLFNGKKTYVSPVDSLEVTEIVFNKMGENQLL